ncbi:MAG: energy transducer TonB [Rhodanobacteraceae bacterium]|nr:MAG: energy transducer TonB [Rhodanobacteraceae bacterium]
MDAVDPLPVRKEAVMQRVAWSWLACLLLPILSSAHGGVDAAKRSVEASMLVTGEIAVNPDGSVYVYSLDQRDKLPAPVVKLIDGALPHWKFTPVEVDGKPVLAKASMSLRIVAKQIDADHAAIRVKSAAFGTQTAQSEKTSECANSACLTYLERRPPIYPSNLVNDLVSGTVYLAVEVDRQGKVSQVAVEQVDLRRIADGADLDRWRRELGLVSMKAARDWTFQVPTSGLEAGKDHWVVTVPINYSIGIPGERKAIGAPGYGQWDVYVPGPVHSIPWAEAQPKQVASQGGADAVPDNGTPFVADTRFVLLTPIGGDDTPSTSPEATPGQG